MLLTMTTCRDRLAQSLDHASGGGVALGLAGGRLDGAAAAGAGVGDIINEPPARGHAQIVPGSRHMRHPVGLIVTRQLA
jgi:hypothetical protein